MRRWKPSVLSGAALLRLYSLGCPTSCPISDSRRGLDCQKRGPKTSEVWPVRYQTGPAKTCSSTSATFLCVGAAAPHTLYMASITLVRLEARRRALASACADIRQRGDASDKWEVIERGLDACADAGGFQSCRAADGGGPSHGAAARL